MLEQCGTCGTRFAVGLPACPHCWAPLDDGDGGDDEEADVAKITKSGVSFPVEPGPEPEPAAEPIPVAVQKAAGVPPEETVTIADQKAGVPPPELPDVPPAAVSEPEAAELRDPPPPPPPGQAADG